MIGVADTPGSPGLNAFTGPGGTDMSQTWNGILISQQGGYFNSNTSAGLGSGILGGQAEAQAFILIHELAHFMLVPGFLAGDSVATSAGAARQMANNGQILANCENTLGVVAGRIK